MKSSINKNKYKKQFTFSGQASFRDHFLTFYQQNSSQFLSYKPFAYKTQYKNVCVLSGRNRSVLRIFKVSRIQLKKLIKHFRFSGFTFYSWLFCPYGGNGRHDRLKIYFFAGSSPAKGI